MASLGTERHMPPPSPPLFPRLCSPPGAQEQAGVLTGKAVINVLLTVHATEAWRTFAHVAALGVMAETVVHAGLRDTLINVDGTPLTWKQGGNERSSPWKSVPTQKCRWGLGFKLGWVGLLQGYSVWSPALGSPFRFLCPEQVSAQMLKFYREHQSFRL